MGAKWISKVVLVIVICSLSGCGILKEPFEESIYAFFENETTVLIEKKEISKDFCAIIDNLSSMYLSYDENEKLYIRALDTVNEYLEGKLSQEEALKELEKIYHFFDKKIDVMLEFSVDEDLSKKLSAYGIAMEDYKDLIDMGKTEIEYFRDDITVMLIYLGYIEGLQESYENLQFFYSNCIAQRNIILEFRYYSLNAMFVNISETEKKYLQEQVISRAKNYMTMHLPWYDNKDEVLEELGICLYKLEKITKERKKYLDVIFEEADKIGLDYDELPNR